AHKRMVELIDAGKPLPVDLRGRVIYYVGPVRAARNEIVGPAGPTTSSRLDDFTDKVLAETGLFAMVGKAERGPAAIASIVRHKTPYLAAVGGAAYLISKSIKAARIVAFEDLGMEAIYEFDVQDMPVIMAVDVEGNSIHNSGPLEWRKRMAADSIARNIGV
ncbi:fumarate hydratase, partial [Mesorhizobium sp. M7A.F.Ca.CA.004.05.1.1]